MYAPVNSAVAHVVIKHPILLVVLAALMLSPLWSSRAEPAVSLVVQTQEAIEVVEEQHLIAEVMTQELAVKLTDPKLNIVVVQENTGMAEIEVAINEIVEQKGELFIIFLYDELLIDVCDYLNDNHDIRVVRIEEE